jgi:hypothetical protein
VTKLFDAVEDEVQATFILLRVVVARCPEFFDHFDEVGEPASMVLGSITAYGEGPRSQPRARTRNILISG